jgi:hypothetical protein
MTSNTSRTMIAALQVSLEGFIQGPNGEKDRVDSWADAIELIPEVDTFVLGGRMYLDYGEYWESMIQSFGVTERAAINKVYEEMVARLCNIKDVWCLPKEEGEKQ